MKELYMQYLFLYEQYISQRNIKFDSRYKFTAKELDNETSYTYFGASSLPTIKLLVLF